nr:hypothetical protein [Angustibacter aerolatus]
MMSSLVGEGGQGQGDVAVGAGPGGVGVQHAQNVVAVPVGGEPGRRRAGRAARG